MLSRVYPRVYGESTWEETCRELIAGLSPRVRGIRPRADPQAGREGSIPACTGNPGRGRGCAPGMRVYPRVYGESVDPPVLSMRRYGLSPRVRGIPRSTAPQRSWVWSIPACTGNPPSAPARSDSTKVYPRVYGESAGPYRDQRSPEGLSPRVRGIHSHRGPECSRHGSIPACTGNPRSVGCTSRASRVYPRVYGESVISAHGRNSPSGLSPRVRGIQLLRSDYELHLGSIPACTGNPGRPRARRRPVTVYPRVYGESEATRRRLRR